MYTADREPEAQPAVVWQNTPAEELPVRPVLIAFALVGSMLVAVVADARNPREVARGKAHFNALTKRGFRAVALGKDGQPGTLLRKMEETLFIPQFAGG